MHIYQTDDTYCLLIKPGCVIRYQTVNSTFIFIFSVQTSDKTGLSPETYQLWSAQPIRSDKVTPAVSVSAANQAEDLGLLAVSLVTETIKFRLIILF